MKNSKLKIKNSVPKAHLPFTFFLLPFSLLLALLCFAQPALAMGGPAPAKPEPIGRFGKFLACENFPKCKFTKPFVIETNLTCPKDRGKIILKKTKKGRKFYGCSNYPACTFAAWRLEDIKKVQASQENKTSTSA